MSLKKRFIAIDGLDGSGKGTQTKLLCQYLEDNDVAYTKLSFPNYDMETSVLAKMYLNGDFGDDPEAVNPYAASSFFAVDRYASFKLKWQRDYEQGKIMIADRYTSANAVHQLSKLPKNDWGFYLNWLESYEFDLLGLPRPDKVIYLCVPPEISQSLAEKRSIKNGTKMDIHESNSEHLQKSYKAAIFASTYFGWTKIDCATEKGMRSIEDIHSEVLAQCYDILNI